MSTELDVNSFVPGYNIINGFGYALVGLATLTTLGRFYIRWRYLKLDWDDLFNGLALACLITMVGIPAQDDPTTRGYWVSVWVGFVLLWTLLWFVKASFLALCWNIFHVSPSFRKAWWGVTLYATLSYWPIALSHLWNCGDPSDVFNPSVCIYWLTDPSTAGRFLTISIIEAVLHISSELFILTLPLVFITQLQMSRSSKLSAAGIFSVIIVTIAVGSLRTMAYVSNDAGLNSTNSDMIGGVMQNLEPPLAVLVCSLPPYKVFLSKLQERKRKAAEDERRIAANADKMATSSPILEHKPKRNCAAQDSITELEMA